MKKIIIFALCLFTIGCSNNVNFVLEDNVSYDYTSESYTPTSKMYVKYPRFTDGKFDLINKIIENDIISFVQDYYDNIYEGLTLNINYEISYQGKDMISIVYTGTGNVETAAHPTNIFKTININISQNKKVYLSNLYNIDDDFIELFKEEFKKQVNLEKSIILDSYNDNDLKELLKNADLKSNIMSYLKDKNVGLSFEVPHAIGDYITITINNEKLEKFKIK